MKEIYFVSLGCDKNLVDSEQMIGLLAKKGYSFTDDENQAEIIIINSCCFIGDAKEESINTIIELGALKSQGRLKYLVVCGCLAQRYPEEIKSELPEVDAVIGTTAFDEIYNCLEKLYSLKGQDASVINSPDRLTYLTGYRNVTTGGHYAYLKIADGCDKRCTYCIIPSIRGGFRSVPMEDIISDAKALAADGVKELILVAQETTVYGTDIYGEKKLPELLKRLSEIEGIVWIRLLYCYPEEITDELVEVIKTEKKICHYLDLPIQSASDDILRRMGRRCNSKQLRELIEKLRREIPDITLRTTLITGFPGETEEDHEATMDFVYDMEFDRLGVFTYSAEEGTYAASLPNQIDEDIMLDRQAEIMEMQQDIAFSKAEQAKGNEVLAIIEGKVADENVYVGRTYKDAPKVDGYIFISTDENLMTGDFVKVKITGAHEYDLLGELV